MTQNVNTCFVFSENICKERVKMEFVCLPWKLSYWSNTSRTSEVTHSPPPGSVANSLRRNESSQWSTTHFTKSLLAYNKIRVTIIWQILIVGQNFAHAKARCTLATSLVQQLKRRAIDGLINILRNTITNVFDTDFSMKFQNCTNLRVSISKLCV